MDPWIRLIGERFRSHTRFRNQGRITMLTHDSIEDESIDELVNPFNAVTGAPYLVGEHADLVDRDTWIMANAQLIARIGSEAWLARLLDILESGGRIGFHQSEAG